MKKYRCIVDVTATSEANAAHKLNAMVSNYNSYSNPQVGAEVEEPRTRGTILNGKDGHTYVVVDAEHQIAVKVGEINSMYAARVPLHMLPPYVVILTPEGDE